MANRLAMDKSLAIHNLRAAGYSQRRIATTLGISSGAVRRHLAAEIPNGTMAQMAPGAEAQTPTSDPNSTKAQTGQPGDHDADLPAHTEPVIVQSRPTSGSRCEPFRDIITEKLKAGLSAKRIRQDLVCEHGFTASTGPSIASRRRWGTPANFRSGVSKSLPERNFKSTLAPEQRSESRTAPSAEPTSSEPS